MNEMQNTNNRSASDASTEHQTPEDIRALAGRLQRSGEEARRAGQDASHRVAVRTSNLLRSEGGSTERGGENRLVWPFRIGVPLLAAAAVLAGLVIVSRPGVVHQPDTNPGAGADMLAASLEHDLDALAAMDEMWEEDAFETGLAVITLDAAGLFSEDGMQTDALGALGSDL